MKLREIIRDILLFFSRGGIGLCARKKSSIKRTAGDHSNQIARENIEIVNIGNVININQNIQIYNNTSKNEHEGASIENEMSKKEH